MRPIRTLILVLIAFVAGMLYERSGAAEKCTAAGGTPLAGLCKGL
jgi:hypothetical protein